MNVSARAEDAKAIAKKGEEFAKKMMVWLYFIMIYLN